MTAFQRSNVTTRQERGIGPVSFKRMLLAFGVAAVLTMLLGRFIGPIGSCLTGMFAMLFLIAMTHPRYGMPTFIYLLESLRGWLVVQAVRGQLDGMRTSLASLLLVETGAGEIEGSILFNTVSTSEDEELDDPLIFLDTNPAEAGLLVLSSPVLQSSAFQHYPTSVGSNPSSLNSTPQSYPTLAPATGSAGATPVERN